MDSKKSYYSALLKTAESLANSKKLFLKDFAVIPVGIGVENLLKELFEELKDIDEINREFLKAELKLFAEQRKSKNKQNEKENDLTLFEWIEFYKHRGIFSMLEGKFGWEFNRFNGDTLHDIRLNKNLYHDHFKNREKMRTDSITMCEEFNEILIETHRIIQPPAQDLSCQAQTQRSSELALIPSETEVIKQRVDGILRSKPTDIDALILQAYLMNGETLTGNEIEKIIQLDPNHAEAQKELNWNRNYHTEENRKSQNPINILALIQQNISININFGDVLAALAIVVVFLVVLMNHNDTNQSELSLLQTTVEKQSVQFERLENALKEKNTQIEALDADLQQLQTMVQEQPPNLAESANEKENDAPQISSLADKNIAEIQYAPQGESIDGTLRAFVFRMLFVGITLFIAWILISRYFFPRLVEWILSRISLKQVLIAFLLWPIQKLKESIIGFVRNLFPWRRKKSLRQRLRRK